MKQHATAFLLACGALLLFWALLFPKRQDAGEERARPLSFETRADGYAGLERWLGREGVRTASLRRRFDELDQAGLSLVPTGNLLVMTLPEKIALREAEFAALDRWVEAGNTLLVIAGFDDTPAWERDAAPAPQARLQRLTRLRFEPRPTAAGLAARASAVLTAKAPTLRLVSGHPINSGLEALATRADRPSAEWTAIATDAVPVWVLARRDDTQQPAVWLRPVDRGATIVTAWASPFANGQLARADNARWIARVAGWALGEQGAVIFDDMHQGATVYYDADRFFADPRLHRTLAVVVALWFAWVLGYRALRPSPPPTLARDDTALLRTTGGFLAHVLRPADAARELMRHFSDDLRRRLSLPLTGEPPWEWLALQGGVEPAQLERLRGYHASAAAGRRVDLIRLRNLLHELTGRLG